jgi:hypothetical protein
MAMGMELRRILHPSFFIVSGTSAASAFQNRNSRQK